MTVCAVMMVKDEADIIGTTVRHLAKHVDEVIVTDNESSDETWEIVSGLHQDGDATIWLRGDPEIGYYQSRKMTSLADEARERGHDWVLPCDADEIWHVGDTSVRIGDFLDQQPKEVAVVTADLYDHVATDDDGPFVDPVERLGWRRREPGGLPKVAARTLPGLVVEQGNHGAHYPGPVERSGGLVVRHFPYRSLEQFVSKVVNGAAAYEATDLPYDMGRHWREYGMHYRTGGEDENREIFRTWFFSAVPTHDPSLIYDPAPVRR